MITKFSPSTIKKLGYYVYVYSDPDTREPFYVGKGTGNRVFSHLNSKTDKPLTKKINALRRKGKEPKIEILAHGLDEESALIVESAAIDLLGIDNLSNRQRGYESRLFGIVEAELLEARYSREELDPESITESVMFIRINQEYHNEITPLELYESTRGYWTVNVEHANRVKYVMPVYDGVILEVYEVATWLPSGSTHMEIRPFRRMPGRYEFVGKLAPKRMREKYINKSVASYFTHGNSNPIKYEGEEYLK